MYLITTLLLISLTLTHVLATIDINMAEMLYIANHITQADCRRLIAALHSESYEFDSHVAQVGLVLPETTPCIDLLVHWNSNPGEGQGKTQEILSRRLRQLGKHELATWLSKTVFSQLAKRLDDLELITNCPNVHTSSTEEVPTTLEILEDFEEEIIEQQKSAFDTVWIAAVALLAAASLILILIFVPKFIVAKLRHKSDSHEYSSLSQV